MMIAGGAAEEFASSCFLVDAFYYEQQLAT